MYIWDTIVASKKDGEPDKFVLTRDGVVIGTPFETYQAGMGIGHIILVVEAVCCRQYNEADYIAVEKVIERVTSARRSKAA